MGLQDQSPEPDVHIAEVLLMVRRALNLSRAGWASALGVAEMTVRRWEKSERDIQSGTLAHIRETLRQPLLRARLWRSEDIDRLAVEAGLVDPMPAYVERYVRGLRILVSAGAITAEDASRL